MLPCFFFKEGRSVRLEVSVSSSDNDNASHNAKQKPKYNENASANASRSAESSDDVTMEPRSRQEANISQKSRSAISDDDDSQKESARSKVNKIQGPVSKKPPRKFLEEWRISFPFLGQVSSGKVYCSSCKDFIDYSYAGSAALLKHSNTNKHKNASVEINSENRAAKARCCFVYTGIKKHLGHLRNIYFILYLFFPDGN